MAFSIPKPCSKKWNDLTPMSKNNRFCSSCDREIIDFDILTDEQIQHLLTGNKKKICAKISYNRLPIKTSIK